MFCKVDNHMYQTEWIYRIIQLCLKILKPDETKYYAHWLLNSTVCHCCRKKTNALIWHTLVMPRCQYFMKILNMSTNVDFTLKWVRHLYKLSLCQTYSNCNFWVTFQQLLFPLESSFSCASYFTLNMSLTKLLIVIGSLHLPVLVK